MQYDLFNSPPLRVHAKENNPESQNNLQNNRMRLSGKCRELLVRLCNGERLKFAECVYTIGDLRRRSLDLIEAGVPVCRKFLNDEKIKTYFLKSEDIYSIKKRFFSSNES